MLPPFVLVPLLALPLQDSQPASRPLLVAGGRILGEIGADAERIRTRSGRQLRGVRIALRADHDGPITVSARSFEFNAYLMVLDRDGRTLAEDDDGWVERDARATVAARRGDPLQVLVLSAGRESGEFTVLAAEGPPPERSRLLQRQEEAEHCAEHVAWLERTAPDSPELATQLNFLARYRFEDGRVAEALPLCRRALELREHALGQDHDHTITSRGNYGKLLELAGRHEEASAQMERALADAERALGPDHECTIGALGMLASHRLGRGRHDEALRMFRRMHADCERTVGPDARLTAEAVNNIGSTLFQMGQFAEAAAWFLRSLAMHEARFGPVHEDLVLLLDNVGACHTERGHPEDARPVLERALGIVEQTVGPDHPRTARSLQTLAAVHMLQERPAEALPLFVRVAAIWDARRDAFAQDRCHARANLGLVYSALGRLTDAARELATAIDLWRELDMDDHPTAARLTGMMAQVRLDQGQAEAAGKLAQEAHERLLRTLGAWHPATGRARGIAALAAAALGQDRKARELLGAAIADLEAAQATDSPSIVELMHALAETEERCGEPRAALTIARRETDARRAALERQLPTLSEPERLTLVRAQRESIKYLLRLQRQVPDAMSDADAWGYLLQWKGQVARGLLHDRAFLRRQIDPGRLAQLDRLATVLARLAGGLFDGNDGTQLIAERRRLERTLFEDQRAIGSAPAGAASRAGSPAIARDLLAALAPGEALLDFSWSDRQVLAFVVRRDLAVRCIDLGAGAPLAAAIQAHLQLVARTAVASASPAVEATARRLRALLWTPLMAHLGQARSVVVSPDGVLATLPFETLAGEQPGSFLIEEVELSYVQSAESLLRPVAPKGRGALLVGAVDYDGGDVAASQPATRPASRRFAPLPATAREVAALAALAQATAEFGPVLVMTGSEPTRERFADATRGRRFVHLATHGYFADRRAATPNELPGLRSGLVLAGANRSEERARANSLLTAEQAAWLDLSGCELVTLSACETGLGTVEAGEHLMGLRRALHLAGAAASLTALWRIGDDATLELMTGFYRRLWQEGMPRGAALRATQLEFLRRGRTPGVWGAFVLEGDRRY